MAANSRILVIGDIHSPHNHADLVAFLSACKKRYDPDLVIQIGDEIDGHSFSFHDPCPDLRSPGYELEAAIRRLKPLYALFPKVSVIESNHGSLIYRKALAAGLPAKSIRTYREILDAPAGWVWHFDLTVRMSNGRLCYFHHSKGGGPMTLSQSMGMCAVTGHHHERFAINYWASPAGLFWQAATGCLVDDESLAMAYNKTNMRRPINGAIAIIGGHPRLEPMIKKANGRWNGSLS